VIFIQEPYLHKNIMAGIKKSNRSYISHEDKCRAVIIITNNKIVAVFTKQQSNADSVLLELRYSKTRLFAESMYLDITKEIERELDKIEEIPKGMELSSRSTAIPDRWHGKIVKQIIGEKYGKNIP
jgi:hypothetical protein